MGANYGPWGDYEQFRDVPVKPDSPEQAAEWDKALQAVWHRISTSYPTRPGSHVTNLVEDDIIYANGGWLARLRESDARMQRARLHGIPIERDELLEAGHSRQLRDFLAEHVHFIDRP